MLVTRYGLAAEHGAGKDVLEVASGSGIGLGLLARHARRVVGGDYTAPLLRIARRLHGGATPLVRLDASTLPFGSRTFDIVVLYEAIYYLAEPHRFIHEARRVLRTPGELLICSVNPEWSDFNPSPFSVCYFGPAALRDLLESAGFRVDLFGGFPAHGRSTRDRLVSFLKRRAVTFGLMPRSMRGKQWLKRLFLGPLRPVPREVSDGLAIRVQLVPLVDGINEGAFKVLYAVARLGA